MMPMSTQIKSTPILAIDDEQTNLKLLDKMLRAEGYTRLTLLDDPRRTIDAYRETSPGLILLDLNMPHLDGYAVMAQLRALDDPMLPPVIVLTAQSAGEFLLRAFKSGARDYVTKPFDRAELMARVRNLLEAHLAHRITWAQNSVLEELVRERTAKLRKTRLQVVRRLGRAAEYRDNETGNHILRMSKISALLAARLGWSPEDCELMLHASPMHDIGKIGVPDHVLLKPGKLDPAEWELMQSHVSIGADILSDDDTDLMVLARSIALTHHEKWDGTGYPNGLAGEAIPQEGRIVALADVFDALTSERPYKRAWPVEEAVSHIREQSGRHFDPAVVEAFLDALPEIVEIRARHSEP
ncbi:two-component system response regulator [Thalassobaculum fulvum]|jgi:putative two-component system response regulator|uniref:Two-component system response regulator n=2 Tax=Thalassobaculum fulvum TaxID=1633335 RepID=A0A919CPK8_9PROT|nr:two-component system response regulator [Thalassobaculum fulvum]